MVMQGRPGDMAVDIGYSYLENIIDRFKDPYQTAIMILLADSSQSIDSISNTIGLNREKTEGYLEALRNERYVRRSKGSLDLTGTGRVIADSLALDASSKLLANEKLNEDYERVVLPVLKRYLKRRPQPRKKV